MESIWYFDDDSPFRLLKLDIQPVPPFPVLWYLEAHIRIPPTVVYKVNPDTMQQLINKHTITTQYPLGNCYVIKYQDFTKELAGAITPFPK